MRVRTLNSLTRALLPMLAAGLAVVVWPAPAARAAAYTYSSRQRTVNAGVLLVDDANSNNISPVAAGNTPGTPGNTPGADDQFPYVFDILNHRNDLKPFGWNIVNPIAPHTVTGDILERWNSRPNSTTNYALGQLITPDMAPYWEVPLSKTSLTDLSQFDVLLLTIRNVNNAPIRFTDDEIHKLRRFVDSGGQLVIEGDGGTIGITTPTTDGLFFNANFSGGGGTPYRIPASGTLLLHHPTIAAPYLLSQEELSALGVGTQSIASTFLSPVLAGSSNGNPPVLAVAQYGAGQVVMDATRSLAVLNDSVPGVSSQILPAGNGFGPNGASNSGPYCNGPFTDAPAANLKLLVDILSWTGAHPNEYKNSHQSSQSAAVVGPAISPTWTFPNPAAGTSAPGAAINGNFVYVRSADGVLRAFNATPGTDILGTGGTDDGLADYIKGDPYDEIWEATVDTTSSAPTVVTYGGVTYVFIEDGTGKVHAYNAADGSPPTAFAATIGPGSGSYTSPQSAPAPTYFEGRIYAGQPDGSLYVYDLSGVNPATGVRVQFSAAAGPVTASPTIGIVRQNITGQPAGTNAYSDDIIAAVTTRTGVYTLELGSRHDPLVSGGASATPGAFRYNAHSANNLPLNIFPGNPPPPPASVYTDSGGYAFPFTSYPASTNGFDVMPAPAPGLPVYGDYDVDFGNAQTQAGTGQYVLDRDQFAAGGANNGISSTPALASNGNFYYTVNITQGGVTDSTLVCAHDSKSQGTPGPQMIWRFRLPYLNKESNIVDADGVNYGPLAGFQFVGAPVVDKNDNVFVLASYNGQAAVLCFNGTQRVTIQVAAAGGGGRVNSLTQPVPITQTTFDEFGVTPVPIGAGTQFGQRVDDNGQITINSFATQTQAAGAGPTLNPNLSEPQPVNVTFAGNNGAGGSPTAALMHTNLIWYALLPSVAVRVTSNGLIYPALTGFPSFTQGASGLTLVGNSLYFGDANGIVYRLMAYPQNSGLVTNRYAALSSPAYTITPPTNPTVTKDADGRPAVTFQKTSIGSIGGVPSAGNGILLFNGLSGVAAFGSQNTLVADAGRVLELDADGIATWAVDATTRLGANNVSSHLELNHPASISQITANDYLVADTGNNRCVRFDRAGNVVWELTRFNDVPTTIPFYTNPQTGTNAAAKAAPLLAPGEPTTLSGPTSVQSYVQTVTGQGTIVHYLIADTGNNRILEVVDAFDTNGNPLSPSHNLVWVSHTADQQQRRYQYTDASYFTGPDKHTYIAALISNVRLATPLPTTAGALNSATADAPGSTIVLLDYDPSNSAVNPAPHNGFITHAVTSFLAYYTGTGAARRFDLAGSPKTIQMGNSTAMTAATGTATRVYLRNPRFLETYTPPGATLTSPLQNFLLADDNGVYDLFLDSNTFFDAQWGFTQADYQNLLAVQGTVQAAIDATLPLTRLGTSLTTGNALTGPIPFVPNSLQRVSVDTVPDGNNTDLIGHYIVTNGYSQGEVTPVSGFGGETFELTVPPLATTLAATLSTRLFSSVSKPSNTSPLSQPAFAIREK